MLSARGRRHNAVRLIFEVSKYHSIRQTHIHSTATLDEWSDRCRGNYLHNKNNRQTSMHPAEFEPAIPGNKRPQTHALYRAVTGIGKIFLFLQKRGNNFRRNSGRSLPGYTVSFRTTLGVTFSASPIPFLEFYHKVCNSMRNK